VLFKTDHRKWIVSAEVNDAVNQAAHYISEIEANRSDLLRRRHIDLYKLKAKVIVGHIEAGEEDEEEKRQALRTRHRGSNEALVRRIVQGKELYQVNTVVDINNLISLETLHSAGTFDLERIQPPVVFRTGQSGEFHLGIGRGEIKIAGLPVFADAIGPFGSTTSDSERTMVRLETKRILMVVISFLGAEGMKETLRRAAGLLERYAAGSGVETRMLGWAGS